MGKYRNAPEESRGEPDSSPPTCLPYVRTRRPPCLHRTILPQLHITATAYYHFCSGRYLRTIALSTGSYLQFIAHPVLAFIALELGGVAHA